MNKINAYDQILDVAESLIQTQGYNGFSFRDIAATVGIKTSSIHYHFPTKTDLGKAVVARHIAMLYEELMTILEDEKLTYKKKLHAYFTNFVTRTYHSNRKMCLGGMLASDVLTLPEPIQAEVKTYFNLNERWLEKLFALGKAQGEFKLKGTAKGTAEYVDSLLEGGLLLARLFQDETRLTNAWKQIELMV